MREPFPIAIAISDLHLSLTMPACRADKDWLEVQKGYLVQLDEIASELPVICAGDLFDRWNAPPELINFALKHLPDGMLCIPGQHDLPGHRIDLMHRSGYGVLKQAGKIKDLSDDKDGRRQRFPASDGQFVVHGFGWGQKIEPPCDAALRIDNGFAKQIAIVHQYVWTINHSYPGAPEESHLNRFMKPLKRYDVAVFGDNHQSFIQELKTGTTVLNCGTFIRRKSDEIDYQPSVGIIMSDGSVKRKKLDTSGDRFHESVKDRPETPFDMKAFIDGLEGLGEHGLDFKAAVENYLKTEDVNPKVKEIILQCIETK